MELDLQNRRVLVTGGSQGIGLAVARGFLAEGAKVAIVARDEKRLARAAAELSQIPGAEVRARSLDLAQSGAAQALADEFFDTDILVNNAGAIPTGDIFAVDEARWRAAWELKVFGYINMCRAFYPLMRGWKSGVIINVLGVAAINHDSEYICGVAGNAALEAFTQSLGSVSARDGVRVLGVHPGATATERLVGLMKKKAQDRTGNAESWRELVKPLPFGRAAMPEEIGAAIAFLASEKSAYTSGTILTVDGGASARAQSF